LFGLQEALSMFHEEGLNAVFARHARLAEATRRAVCAWGLRPYGTESSEWSNTVTTVDIPDGLDADALRKTILDRFDMSLGSGLGKLKGKVFRIGHLGDLNALMLAGTLCGIEMGLALEGILTKQSGVTAALEYLTTTARASD
jgi:alanine-glyoxylate transaminase / serine-glyoxylate transaminase / serine-pyruvate transaminase